MAPKIPHLQSDSKNNSTQKVSTSIISSISSNRQPKPTSYHQKGIKTINNFTIVNPQKQYNILSKNKISKHRIEAKKSLTSNEKNIILSFYQKNKTKYMKLKSQAASAKRHKKIFKIFGSNQGVRKALTSRGWVEKIPPSKLNVVKLQALSKRNSTEKGNSNIPEIDTIVLSGLVEKYSPNFIWFTRTVDLESINLNAQNQTVINKLRMNTLWTSKLGLCSATKKSNWFYIENIAEVNAPRTYSMCEGNNEIQDFNWDYRITACTSLLKWILMKVELNQPLFVENGKISIKVVVFALNRCKDYLYKRRHRDMDQEMRLQKDSHWNYFLSSYNRLISGEQLLSLSEYSNMPIYIEYSKVILIEVFKTRPELHCEGWHNVWIIKPAYCCRGRGIQITSDIRKINELCNKNRRVVQKYIEDPLLIYETKFDIRQYYLITSTYPLVIWMYRDCYLKFSSQKYDLENYHESIHLTNNAIQRKYKNTKNRDKELPCHNMWTLEQYKKYLSSIGKSSVWDENIYPGMKKSIIGVMLSSQDEMTPCKKRFELYGCDFVLDKCYKTWLIEINSCPDLHPTTDVTAKICPAVLEDIIKVVVDHKKDRTQPTGNFECVYRQVLTSPALDNNISTLVINGKALPRKYFCQTTQLLDEPQYDQINIEKQLDLHIALREIENLYKSFLKPHIDNYVNRDSITSASTPTFFEPKQKSHKKIYKSVENDNDLKSYPEASSPSVKGDSSNVCGTEDFSRSHSSSPTRSTSLSPCVLPQECSDLHLGSIKNIMDDMSWLVSEFFNSI